MSQTSQPVNSILPLRNVSLLLGQIDRVMTRQEGEPGMACFYGPAGYGKSFAKIYSMNKHRAYGVQADDTWTKKVMCLEILKAMGIDPAGTIAEMVRQIAFQLDKSRRPLIIDEADFVVRKGLIETLRTIYELSLAPIILIGEQNLPLALRKWERVFSRVLDWTEAEPLAFTDCRLLAKRYCRDIEVADDLLKGLYDNVCGRIDQHGRHSASVRRFVIGLSAIRKQAMNTGRQQMAVVDFKGDFFPGDPRPFLVGNK